MLFYGWGNHVGLEVVIVVIIFSRADHSGGVITPEASARGHLVCDAPNPLAPHFVRGPDKSEPRRVLREHAPVRGATRSCVFS